MRKCLLGSAMLLVCLSQMPAQGKAVRAAAGADASAQQAIVQCRRMYGGDRGKAVNQARPIWIESCFKVKTGRYPFELGIPIYPPGYDWLANPDNY